MSEHPVSSIISLLVGALYNIVDQIFIANAQYLGSFGNAASTVVFPMTVFSLAIAVMIGDGCCAYVSLSLGKNQKNNADVSVGNSITLAVVCGVILMIIYLIFQEQLISMFGGRVNTDTFNCCKEYFMYISLGIPAYMFAQAMNPIIRADGSPKYAMASTLAGATVNIILDPIFIYIFRLGMMGAAIATVFGQIVTAAMSVWYLCNTKIITVTKKHFRPSRKIVKATLKLGICSFLSQISLVVAMAAINNMIQYYSASDEIFGQEQYAQIPMAVVGIVMKFSRLSYQ